MRTCPACGHANPDVARFCASCGAALETFAGRETRKIVTVVFADVAGSTALGETLDPEALRQVMARYFTIAKASLEAHGASVEKFIGDAVMAVFGVPATHEDDALRAVRAAADLRAAMLTLNAELETSFGVSLHLRIGVNTGDVVVGTEERLATGDAVNVAARLEQAASPDEILLGHETRALARDAIEVEPARQVTVKGKSDPVVAYQLVRVIEGAAAFERRLDAPLIGRRAELDVIRAAFAAASVERRGQLVTIYGPPGIGKSRLAHEIAAELSEDARILVGRCLPYGEGITYWPLREIFAADGAEGELASALGSGGAEEVFLAVRKLIERRARVRPLVLVFEDIHWAEATLLDLIEHLVDWTREAPLLVLCLARPELLDQRPAWAAGRVNVGSLTLEPLDEVESGQLIEGLLGRATLDAAARRRIREVAEGNPLFVEQLVVTLAEGGDLERIPSTIQALLAARLDTLSESERDVLERGSVIGTEFEWEGLARLDAGGRRPTGALLSGLMRKELIRPNEAVDDGFRFRHALIRDAAYERISKGRRADLHERTADWLEGRDEDLDAVIGYHLEQAYRAVAELGRPGERGAGLAVRAAGRLGQAGLRAYARGDPVAGTNLLERAAELLPADDRRRIALLPFLGRALRLSGQMERAELILVDAIERGKAAGERGIAADAAVALVDLRFHRSAFTGVTRRDVFQQLDAAIQVFEETGDQAGLGRALCLGGKLRFWAGQAAASVRDFERAANVSRDSGDPAEEAEAIQGLIGAQFRGPMPVDVVQRTIVDLEARADLNQGLAAMLLETRAQLAAMGGDFETAREMIAKASAAPGVAPVTLERSRRALPAQGAVELLAGQPAAAERAFRPACEGMEQAGELGYLSSVAPLLVDALHEQGRDDEALEASNRWQVDRLTVPEDADAQLSWRRSRSKVLASLGQLTEAEQLAREAVAIAAGTDFLDDQGRAAADLGEVLWVAGNAAEAQAATEEAIRFFEIKGNVAAVARTRDRATARGRLRP